MADEQYLSFEEAAAALGMDEDSLLNLVAGNELRAFRIHGEMKFRASDVELKASSGSSAEDEFDSVDLEDLPDDIVMVDDQAAPSEAVGEVEVLDAGPGGEGAAMDAVIEEAASLDMEETLPALPPGALAGGGEAVGEESDGELLDDIEIDADDFAEAPDAEPAPEPASEPAAAFEDDIEIEEAPEIDFGGDEAEPVDAGAAAAEETLVVGAGAESEADASEDTIVAEGGGEEIAIEEEDLDVEGTDATVQIAEADMGGDGTEPILETPEGDGLGTEEIIFEDDDLDIGGDDDLGVGTQELTVQADALDEDDVTMMVDDEDDDGLTVTETVDIPGDEAEEEGEEEEEDERPSRSARASVRRGGGSSVRARPSTQASGPIKGNPIMTGILILTFLITIYPTLVWVTMIVYGESTQQQIYAPGELPLAGGKLPDVGQKYIPKFVQGFVEWGDNDEEWPRYWWGWPKPELKEFVPAITEDGQPGGPRPTEMSGSGEVVVEDAMTDGAPAGETVEEVVDDGGEGEAAVE